MIDILIANNNQIAGEGLRTILQSKLGNRVLGIVNSIDELKQQSKRYFPDIVVIDFQHDAFGLPAIKAIKQIYRDSRILAITDALPSSTIHTALKNGVDSYLLSDCEKPEIMEAIADTYEGKQFYCGLVIDILSDKNSEEAHGCSGISLSEREIEIIKLISDGCTNKEIADQLFLSTHTVNTHRKNIMSKLGIKNTAGIVIYAVKENIIKA
ncbi:MAG: response regulator transcription factor [Flavobacteriales bacterium]|nr:response regulator transcription factor [Flavobacteriales bacterium]